MIEQHGMKDFEKQCQSCGAPLSESNCGTEFGYVASKRYCKNCMKNGEFLEKNITANDIIKRRKEEVENNSSLNNFKKKMLLMMIPSQVKKLERWKGTKTQSNVNADNLNTYSMSSMAEEDSERDFAKRNKDDFEKAKKEYEEKEVKNSSEVEEVKVVKEAKAEESTTEKNESKKEEEK